MTKTVDLVDIGGGNIGSVKRCLERLNIEYRNVNIDSPPKGDNPLLLPGVGAFGPVMKHLRQSRFEPRLKALINGGTPYLGICIGMQILFERSEEADDCPGLEIIPGDVVAFKSGKVPQIGWNLIEPNSNGAERGYVYFVNSYYPKPSDDQVTSYYANYYVPFCAAVKTKNITAFQFHPEKSGDFGQQLLRRWLDEVG
ncbi:MAG: imidazole glycerol phosphate synthase subunit HisH [Candidatus Melainabacteria bacterium]|nr:MAG: imidazole glycerol phosphate synthase subunit HisH [Candidatus Melainabacteria bacterium]